MAISSQKPKIIVFCGPTGAGKTGFAIEIAKQFNGEIVGADSMQIYRFMDIGTAKPTSGEQAAVCHHMIDVVDPDQDFDAAAYMTMADDVINRLISRRRTVFVVGGTGFYIKALAYGLFQEGPSDPDVRIRLKLRVREEGTAVLHQELAQIDRASADRIHVNDAYRIVRALEVYAVSGEPLSVFQKRHGFREPRFNLLTVGLTWPRPVLYDRINRRVEIMMEQGFMTEVRGLLDRGYDRTLKSMQSLGYRHLSAVISGEQPLAEAVTMLKRDHRRYAKRQLTWFRASPDICWFEPTQIGIAKEKIDHFLSNEA